MKYSISTYLHHVIDSQLPDCKTLIDMGGTGKMDNRGFKVTNANAKHKLDGTNLPFKNKFFDASVSVVTLEHAGNEDKQIQFIDESVRVAKKKILHWIPIHKEVEYFLKELGHHHPAIMPGKKVLTYLRTLGFKQIDSITVREHLLNLVMIKPGLECDELYEYAQNRSNHNYLVLLEKIL